MTFARGHLRLSACADPPTALVGLGMGDGLLVFVLQRLQGSGGT
ncbi:hypothetical protein PhaeoP18_00864 [Phaeobacter piscinae]|uniref:Uncharacterized protein n=1 Tax=Phaeobacter piscinae TaxID=1580596 RepID=A0AAN1GPP7_9RHOB|nr:hypothetical protein PhaeoP13_00879 [Phaeobacter piscinae]AUR35147.1 hypothetical protein PhaeoP18_00864 [Phaeobacter piscinae]